MSKVENVSYPYLCGAVDLNNADTNDYTGSLSFDGHGVGAYEEHFNYKLHLHAEDKKPVKIIAYWYIGVYCFDKTDPSVIRENEFEASVDGAAAAVAWLQSEYEREKSVYKK